MLEHEVETAIAEAKDRKRSSKDLQVILDHINLFNM
jgi:hypothetical protein